MLIFWNEAKFEKFDYTWIVEMIDFLVYGTEKKRKFRYKLVKFDKLPKIGKQKRKTVWNEANQDPTWTVENRRPKIVCN